MGTTRGDKSVRDAMSARETISLILTRLFCNSLSNQDQSFLFFKKNEEVNNSTAVYDGVGLAQEKWPPPHFLHCFYPTCHFDVSNHVSRHDF